MSARTSKLPGTLAIIGVAVPFVLEATWRWVEAHGLWATYYPSLLTVTLVLWPGNILGFVVEDFPGVAWSLIAWLIGVASKGLLYFWLGRGIVALRGQVRRRAEQG